MRLSSWHSTQHAMAIVVAVLAVVLANAAGVIAQSSTRGHELQEPSAVGRSFLPTPRPDVVSTVTLRPDPLSTVVLPAFEMDILRNGKRSLRSVLISQKGSDEQLVFFTIDPELRTYRTYAPEELPEIGPRELERLRRHSADKLVSILCTCASNPCSGAWTASITTYDPVYVPLTVTAGSANWHQADVGGACKLLDSNSRSCWAANPSSLGTHWFTSGCSSFQNDPFGVNFNASGSYYNWDFGLDSLYTYVDQSVRIQLLHAIGVVTSYQHTDSGEGAPLIFGSFYHTGHNSCFEW